MRLSAKAQVTIPKSIRQAAGLEPGDEMECGVKGAVIHLKKKRPGLRKWIGFLGPFPAGAVDRTIAGLRGRR